MAHFKTRNMADQVATVARRMGYRAVVVKTSTGFTVLHTV